jgi:hypothetical protein
MSRTFGSAQYRVFGLFNEIAVFAGGTKPSPQAKVILEIVHADLDDVQLALYFESPEIVNRMIMPFSISKVINISPMKIDHISILDSKGLNTVNIETPFSAGEDLNISQINQLMVGGSFSVFQQLGHNDKCFIAPEGSTVPAVFREAHTGTYKECHAWKLENCQLER